MLAYNISWAIGAIFIGMTSYVLDRWFGTKIYRSWYNLTHKDSMDPSLEVGFIHARKAKYRFGLAFALSFVFSLLSIFFGGQNPAVQIVTFFILLPTLMIGFYLGPAFFRMWGRKDIILEKVDDMESGKIDLGAEMKQAALSARGKIIDAFIPEPDSAKPEQSAAQLAEQKSVPISAPPSAPAAEPPTPAEPDPEKMYRKFVDDGGK